MIKTLELLGYNRVGVILAARAASLVRGEGVVSSLQASLKNKLRTIRSKFVTRNRGYIVDNINPTEKGRYVINSLCNEVKSEEFLQGHIGYSDELLLKLLSDEFRVIVTIRDPRAILLSHYHYIPTVRTNPLWDLFRNISDEEKFQVLIDGYHDQHFSVPSMYAICNSISCWLKDHPSLLIVKFEDLIGPQGGGSIEKQEHTIREIATLLDLSLGEEAIAETANELFGGTRTFRKGRIDSWKEEIPRAIRRHLEDSVSRFIEKWDYEFEFS